MIARLLFVIDKLAICSYHTFVQSMCHILNQQKSLPQTVHAFVVGIHFIQYSIT